MRDARGAFRIPAEAVRQFAKQLATTPAGERTLARSLFRREWWAKRKAVLQEAGEGAGGYSTPPPCPPGIPDADRPDSG